MSCPRWHAGLEPVGDAVVATAQATSRSAVSRRFVRATEAALGELLPADLSGLDLVAVMIDGAHFAGYCCPVALGIDIMGVSTRWRWWKAPPRTPRWSKPTVSSPARSPCRLDVAVAGT